MRRFLIIVLFAVCWSSPASAATPYYEFSPDYAKSLLVASSEAVAQIFLPQNDYLGALDLWVSNADVPGDATFTLYNSAGSALTSRTVSVPAIADSETGTRLHVTLPSQLAVAGGSAYSLGVTSAVPSFRLYYGDATKILAHNGVPLPAYTGGLARIGGEDMGFSFKFALFENAESSAPVISNVTVSQPNLSQAVLSFNVNEPVDRRVSYNSSAADWTGGYSSCVDGIQSCSVSLSVIPGTAYTFTLSVRDVWGNDSQVSGTFTATGQGQTPTPTPASMPTATVTPTATATATPTSTPDASMPVISNLRAVNATASSIGIAWTTSKATDSSVVVQLLPYFINAAVGSDATLELEHYIEITGLDSDTAYVARITSTDTLGNGVAASLNIRTTSVTVVAPTPTTSPDAPTPTPTIIVAGNPDDPVVSWQQPAQSPTGGYRVDVFDANNNLITTVHVPAGQLDIALGGLPEGQHRVVVYADHDGVFQKVASETRVPVRRATSSLERIVSWMPYLLLAVVVSVSIAVLILKKRGKPPVVTPPASPPAAPAITRP